MLHKITEAYKLWHQYFLRLPRLSRFSLGTKIDFLFTKTIEIILSAGYTSLDKKILAVQKANTKLNILNFFLKLSWELKLLDHKKYGALSTPLVEVGKMLGGWRKQLINNPAK